MIGQVSDVKAIIKRAAEDAGFDLAGIAPATDSSELKHFPEWIAAGYAGPAVADGRVYVTDRVAGDSKPGDPFQRGKYPGLERVFCINAADGRVIWQKVGRAAERRDPRRYFGLDRPLERHRDRSGQPPPGADTFDTAVGRRFDPVRSPAGIAVRERGPPRRARLAAI